MPELGRVVLRVGGIDRRFDGRPNPFYVIRMHPPPELLDICPVFSNFEHLFQASIPPDDATDRIVLPPPEQGCVQGKLQTIFAVLQVLRRLLPLDCKAHPGNEDHEKNCQQGK